MPQTLVPLGVFDKYPRGYQSGPRHPEPRRVMTTAPPARLTPRHVAAPAHGPLGRLGLLTATRRRAVFIAWALLVVALGAFAPRVESALAGAGWEASGSESVQTRDVVQREFA